MHDPMHDPGMHLTKKGVQIYFGMKAHVDADEVRSKESRKNALQRQKSSTMTAKTTVL